MFGKVIVSGPGRRPEPYSTSSRSSKTSETGKTDDSHQNESIYGTDNAETDDETDGVPDDSESDLDYQPNNHADTCDDGTDLDGTANEDLWPEQFPTETDKMERYRTRFEPFQPRKERLTVKQRILLWGNSSFEHVLIAWKYIHDSKRHEWLPEAYDERGRPYEKTCDRVWKSWWRYERDMFARSILSVEEGDSGCPTPVTMEFPKRRYRHAKRGRKAAKRDRRAAKRGRRAATNSQVASSSPALTSGSPATSSAAGSSSAAPTWRQKCTTFKGVDTDFRHSDPARKQLSEDLKTSLLTRLAKLYVEKLSKKEDKQLRMESVEALRRIKGEGDKVLVYLKEVLELLLQTKSVATSVQ